MLLTPITKKENIVPHDQVASVRKYVAAASAPATRKAYSSDWRQFEMWCFEQGVECLMATPATVAAYVADQAYAGKKVATLERALVAIAKAHQLANTNDPTKHLVVKETMKGIRRHLSATQKKAQPLLFEALKTVVAALDCEKVREVRDRAILCLGFMTGLRRSELVALDVEDLQFEKRGMTVHVRRSKGDQVGEGCCCLSWCWPDLSGGRGGELVGGCRHRHRPRFRGCGPPWARTPPEKTDRPGGAACRKGAGPGGQFG